MITSLLCIYAHDGDDVDDRNNIHAFDIASGSNGYDKCDAYTTVMMTKILMHHFYDEETVMVAAVVMSNHNQNVINRW